MALMELIDAAIQRQTEREKARLQAERERQLTRFRHHLVDVFGENFVEKSGGKVKGTPHAHVSIQHAGNTYRLHMRPNRDASRTWMVDDRELFLHGRQPEQDEAVDVAVLAIADLAQSEQDQPEPGPSTQTVRLEEIAEESEIS